jgi:branched-chain amino acid transport system ATP-binding protein
MLKVVHLCAGYGSLSILHGISFHIEKGEIVTLIGGNGAGKSTAMKAVSGEIPMKDGKLFFNGQRIDALSPERRVHSGLSFVPENRGLFGGMTVEENLRLGAFRLHLGSKKLRKSIEEIWEIFPVLRDRAHQKAKTMSGGEQQMLAIAKGLMSQPELMLLDEPSVGLAPLLVKEIFSQIKRLREKGVTLLLVEQNVHYALDCADRGYVIERGRIVCEGSSGELRENEGIKRAYLGVQE